MEECFDISSEVQKVQVQSLQQDVVLDCQCLAPLGSRQFRIEGKERLQF